MLVTFKKHIDTNFPFLEGKKIMIAISGGIDSVVLTHLLYKLNVDISLAHCNFRLRGNASDEDQLFAQELANQMNVAFYTTNFDTSKYAKEIGYSTQMAARELRYDWFEKIRAKNNLDYVATAHHLDDNLETFLINFSRGTGLKGLTGIPPINKSIVRPLLVFSRDEIEQYAKENGVIWREDKSNQELTYQRNKIRHQVVPILKELNPQLVNSFKKTHEYLTGSRDIIEDKLTDITQDVIASKPSSIKTFNISKILALSNPKAYLFELLNDYGFTEWNDILGLLSAQSGKTIFSQTHRLIKDRDHFLLEPIAFKEGVQHISIFEGQDLVNLKNFRLHFKKVDISEESEFKNCIHVDADKLEFPLTLRKWEAGDYFHPFKMTGKKKVSKYFKDEKLSLIDKERTWFLCSNNDIVWVVNRRLDDRFKITKDTKKIIRIEYFEE